MAWTVSLEPRALAELKRLDRTARQRVVKFLQERVSGERDPRSLGKALTGQKVHLWRYRIGDYRVICRIDDEHANVLVLRIGHRKEIYR